MKKRSKYYFHYILNLIVPAFVFSAITGILASLVVNIYKLCAKHIIHFSEAGYHFLREHLWYVPAVLTVLFGFSFLLAYIYRKVPNLKGGGIPTSIAVLRGLITFKWLRNLIGIFLLSLTTFLIGVPLGNEGPSVQMGMAIGRGSVYSRKHKAWNRYSMTGGACAGFAVATGAPISGIMFAIEEAHQRISPMIILVALTSVMFAGITTELIAPILGISVSLFPQLELIRLDVTDVWIPVVVGLVIGLFAVAFLSYYQLISRTFNKKLQNVPHQYKIFFVFLLTVVLGLCSYRFISTGHELIIELIEGDMALIMLLLVLMIRATLTLCGNTNRLTGGTFVPLLALGVVLAAVIGKILGSVFALDQAYGTIILALGITACIASLMKMPICAIVFAVEALGFHENILYAIITSCVAYLITELFDAKSINDTVVEEKVEDYNTGRRRKVIDTYVTVEKNSFAVGKQIRDIFWPANLFVLSVKHDETKGAEIDWHGGKVIHVGDVLHVRYSTYDDAETREELMAIIGTQNYSEVEADKI